MISYASSWNKKYLKFHYDGTVEVTAIAQEVGDRAKVARTSSRDKNIDPVGTYQQRVLHR